MSVNRIVTAFGLAGILATSLATANAATKHPKVVHHTAVVHHYRHRHHHYTPSVHTRVTKGISAHGKMTHAPIVKNKHM